MMLKANGLDEMGMGVNAVEQSARAKSWGTPKREKQGWGRRGLRGATHEVRGKQENG